MYAVVVAMLLLGVQRIFGDQYWMQQNKGMGYLYIALLSFSVVFIVWISVGLLKIRNWARIIAIPWNIAIAFLMIGLKVVATYLLSGEGSSVSEQISYLKPDTVVELSVGVVLIILSFLYLKKTIKDQFL
jgi:hypothetical protein